MRGISIRRRNSVALGNLLGVGRKSFSVAERFVKTIESRGLESEMKPSDREGLARVKKALASREFTPQFADDVKRLMKRYRV